MELSCAGIDMVFIAGCEYTIFSKGVLSHSMSVQCPSALTSLAAHMPPLVVQS
jgi:hypothetical protein